MLHKLLKYLVIVVLITTTSQCLSKCQQKPPYNTANVDLKWEEEHHPVTLAGLVLEEAKGLTCHITSENATYFLNAEDGSCWKFTQEGSGLTCQNIGSLQPFNLNNSFVFAAGTMDTQSLFFGSISGNNIEIYKLESEAWNKIIDGEDLTAFFPGTTINTNKFVVSCTVEVEQEKKGCIILKLQLPAPKKDQVGCLLFSADEPYLKIIPIDPIYNETNQETYLIGIVEVKKGRLLLGKGHKNSYDRYDLLSLEYDNLTFIPPDIVSPFTVPNVGFSQEAKRPVWEIFPLFLKGEFPIAEPIFSIYHQGKRAIYRTDDRREFQEMTLLSDPENKILNKKSLLVPFHNELYWVTNITSEEGNVETVFYRATLVTTTKKPDTSP